MFTPYGEDFAPLVNQYNLIKHLPTLEKLEFQKYVAPLQGIEKHAIGLVLLDLRDLIETSQAHIGSTKPEHILKTYLKGKYSFKVCFPDDAQLNITIIINSKLKPTSYFQQGLGLDRYTEEMLVGLLEDFLLDLLTHNNFHCKNETDHFLIQNNLVDINRVQGKTTLIVELRRKDSRKLVFGTNSGHS